MLDLDLVRHLSEAPVAFVLPESIEDHPLLWKVIRSQTYYPKHILAYGGGNTCYSSWVLALSGPAFRGGY